VADPAVPVVGHPLGFDCLYIDDVDLRPRELRARREALMQAIEYAKLLLAARRLADDGLKAWRQVEERGYEGFVAKDEFSPYSDGRTLSRLKGKAGRVPRRGAGLVAAVPVGLVWAVMSVRWWWLGCGQRQETSCLRSSRATSSGRPRWRERAEGSPGVPHGSGGVPRAAECLARESPSRTRALRSGHLEPAGAKGAPALTWRTEKHRVGLVPVTDSLAWDPSDSGDAVSQSPSRVEVLRSAAHHARAGGTP